MNNDNFGKEKSLNKSHDTFLYHDKIKTVQEMAKISEQLKQQGMKLVETNGAYDILHAGHAKFLAEAKKLGDKLLVLMNSDGSVKSYKGPNRPIIPEKERAYMLASLENVDYVVIFEEGNPLKELELIKPGIHTKGGTFMPERIKEEKDLVESWDGEMVVIPVTGFSTTQIIEDIFNKYFDEMSKESK